MGSIKNSAVKEYQSGQIHQPPVINPEYQQKLFPLENN